MAENRDAKQPTHRAYSVIKREGQDDFWLNLGLVFPHKDGGGFNIMLQAIPLHGMLVCREIGDGDKVQEAIPRRPKSNGPACVGYATTRR
jgi:hypothetical protein